MPAPDLNLLITLDVLLAEGSVVGAAKRLRLSPSAMSRALSRLRETTGDPLLVRAGRGLAPTPRALALRGRVHDLVLEVEAVLRPDERLDLAGLVRTFTLRASDGFVESFGPGLLARVGREAPGVRLNFMQKPDKDSSPLRDGRVDLETGVIEESLGPEVRTQALFRDRLVGVVRDGHPLSAGKLTAARYADAQHVIVSRNGLESGAVDLPFLPSASGRNVGAIVSGFSAALTLARGSDLVATVPDRHTATLRQGMFSFTLPLPALEFTVSMLWHPRMDADAAHRWLRGCVREVLREQGAPARKSAASQ
ncbi:LysR family transcriptional regulator [Phenylobacterium sp.]|uniref:LysR family transcriptional regulator n=1 Tax=Phenylobacterium sp. TaxID=1871053 RepID=UPI0027337099|nr:LysR family transcriptional regulator [Phenylobacterium sp.]MDP3635682.1 LysR family transcriptional regulator [Phenylobacterium sp.]